MESFMTKIWTIVFYDGMNISNHVKRYRKWIKYNLLQIKDNRSLRDLIVTIITSVADDIRMKGSTVLDHF